MNNEEDMIVWQDVLDLIQAGRGEGLHCPFCKTVTLQVTMKGLVTRVMCGGCRKFIEGRMQQE